jgi:hypothetical protein
VGLPWWDSETNWALVVTLAGLLVVLPVQLLTISALDQEINTLVKPNMNVANGPTNTVEDSLYPVVSAGSTSQQLCLPVTDTTTLAKSLVSFLPRQLQRISIFKRNSIPGHFFDTRRGRIRARRHSIVFCVVVMSVLWQRR